METLKQYFESFLDWLPWWVMGGFGAHAFLAAGRGLAQGSGWTCTLYLFAGMVLLTGALAKFLDTLRHSDEFANSTAEERTS